MRYLPDPHFLAHVAGSQPLQELMSGRAEEAADYARSIAPVVSGEYAASFVVEELDGVSYLVNTAPYADAVEWGTASIPEGHHVLAQTADWVER